MSGVATEIVREGDPERIEEQAGQVAKIEEIEDGAPWNVVEEAGMHQASLSRGPASPSADGMTPC